MRHVRHEELDRPIGVDSAEGILGQADRQRRPLERARRGRVRRGHGSAPPDVAGLPAEGDGHAHGGHGIEHGEGVALRLVERVQLVLRARGDREAGRGGRRAIVVLVLRDRVVQQRPHEHLLRPRKVLLDCMQYPLDFPHRLLPGRWELWDSTT